MGKPKTLRGDILVKIKTTIEDNAQDLKLLQNKGNWSVEWIGPALKTGAVTAVEMVKASVSK